MFFTPTGERRVVEIVLTREDWDEMADNIGKESPDSVRTHLMTLADDEHFLVADSGVELVPSPTRAVPPDPLDGFVPEPGGQWVATDGAGNVVSRFADWNDVDD